MSHPMNLSEEIRNAMQCDDKEHLESSDFEACYNCQVNKVLAIVTRVQVEAALFALDNETMWQYQRKCDAGEAMKANRKWLVNLLETNIERYKAKLKASLKENQQ